MVIGEKEVLWEYLDLRDVTTGGPLHPLVKEVRLIEVKESRMEKLAEIGASKLFSSQIVKNNVRHKRWARYAAHLMP